MKTKHPITVWRAGEGLSQKDLAAKLGVTRWSVVAIETGRRKPSFTLVQSIVDLTGIPREALRPDVFGEAA